MVLATEGLAENTKNAPMKIMEKTIQSVTLSTVHHQFANLLLFNLEIVNTFISLYLKICEGGKA